MHNAEAKCLKIIQNNDSVIWLPLLLRRLKDNTFEAYLRNEFISLSNGKATLHFEDYLSWRKEKGTFLYDYEIYCIFNDVVSLEDECSLMEFIEITRIIDEGS